MQYSPDFLFNCIGRFDFSRFANKLKWSVLIPSEKNILKKNTVIIMRCPLQRVQSATSANEQHIFSKAGTKLQDMIENIIEFL